MMHGPEKSDPAIVATKPANKAEQLSAERSAAEQNAAEPVERRAGTKGNASQQSTRRTQSRVSVSQALERIRKVASERKKERLTGLFHHVSIDLLEEAFHELKPDAAPGVDGLTWKGFNEEPIGHCRLGASTFSSRTAGSAQSRSQPLRTRSSNGRWSRC